MAPRVVDLDRGETAWRLDGASDHGVSEALYLSDPEDNGIERYRDRPRVGWPTTADGHVEMSSLAVGRMWYVDGLDVRQSMPAALFLADGDYHHHVGLNTRKGRSAPTSGRGLLWFEGSSRGRQKW